MKSVFLVLALLVALSAAQACNTKWVSCDNDYKTCTYDLNAPTCYCAQLFIECMKEGTDCCVGNSNCTTICNSNCAGDNNCVFPPRQDGCDPSVETAAMQLYTSCISGGTPQCYCRQYLRNILLTSVCGYNSTVAALCTSACTSVTNKNCSVVELYVPSPSPPSGECGDTGYGSDCSCSSYDLSLLAGDCVDRTWTITEKIVVANGKTLNVGTDRVIAEEGIEAKEGSIISIQVGRSIALKGNINVTGGTNNELNGHLEIVVSDSTFTGSLPTYSIISYPSTPDNDTFTYEFHNISSNVCFSVQRLNVGETSTTIFYTVVDPLSQACPNNPPAPTQAPTFPPIPTAPPTPTSPTGANEKSISMVGAALLLSLVFYFLN